MAEEKRAEEPKNGELEQKLFAVTCQFTEGHEGDEDPQLIFYEAGTKASEVEAAKQAEYKGSTAELLWVSAEEIRVDGYDIILKKR